MMHWIITIDFSSNTQGFWLADKQALSEWFALCIKVHDMGANLEIYSLQWVATQ